jgi:hypothetical protein
MSDAPASHSRFCEMRFIVFPPKPEYRPAVRLARFGHAHNARAWLYRLVMSLWVLVRAGLARA